jgi:hypothetical protein
MGRRSKSWAHLHLSEGEEDHWSFRSGQGPLGGSTLAIRSSL